jgi:hypothetical protein
MALSPNSRYQAAAGWCFRLFPAEGGVAYHPYTGEFYALDRRAAFVFSRLIDQPHALGRLVVESHTAFPDALLTAEEIFEIVETLCQTGMVRPCQSGNDSPT